MAINFSDLGGGGGGKYEVTVEYISTGSFTVPDDVSSLTIFACGGGGGGGRGPNDTTPGSGGNGSALEQQVTVTPGSTHTITIGAGGSAGPTDGSDGSAGSDTTFGSLLTALGAGGGRQNYQFDAGPQHSGGMGAIFDGGQQLYSPGRMANAGNGLHGRGGGGGSWTDGGGARPPQDGGGWRTGRNASLGNENGLPNYGAGGVGGPRYQAAGNGGSGFVRIKYWTAG